MTKELMNLCHVEVVGVEPARARIIVRGIVQGVGFRPFIYRLANDHELKGWVLNSTEGVVIEIEGPTKRLEEFRADITLKSPPLAVIEGVESSFLPPVGYQSFIIQASQEQEDKFVLISPDICICPECLRELFDPRDRRYHYPFINCTNCGPRFTIVKDIPRENLRKIREVDVVWHKDGRIICIFEVENTTGITEALVRGANIPYSVKCYIVLPEERDALLQSRMREPMLATQFSEGGWQVIYYGKLGEFADEHKRKRFTMSDFESIANTKSVQGTPTDTGQLTLLR